MSILIARDTRVLVQGITGSQARFDTEGCLKYGTRIVAGVTPGRGGENVHGVPVYDTVRRATAEHDVDATVIYVPAGAVRGAVLEALDAGLRLLLVTAEYVPRHDVMHIVAACRRAGARLIGCNTNGMITPGACKLAGIGGHDPDEIYRPGRIGVISRSGGMTAEIGLALRDAGIGISTAVSMGGDALTGTTMAEHACLFEADPDTDAIVVFGEPGTRHEDELAALLRAGTIGKPVVALVAGAFQERYPPGMTFGHAAAMISSGAESASAKRAMLAKAGAHVAAALEQIPVILDRLLPSLRESA